MKSNNKNICPMRLDDESLGSIRPTDPRSLFPSEKYLNRNNEHGPPAEGDEDDDFITKIPTSPSIHGGTDDKTSDPQERHNLHLSNSYRRWRGGEKMVAAEDLERIQHKRAAERQNQDQERLWVERQAGGPVSNVWRQNDSAGVLQGSSLARSNATTSVPRRAAPVGGQDRGRPYAKNGL